MKRVLILAGEESGAIYAKKLEQELRKRENVEVRGYGEYGFKVEDLAVFGYWAVIKKIFFFLRVKRTMERAIDEWKPDAVCTIDYPGLNLKLAMYAKQRGIKAVHVVCPQVWAWHQKRIPKIEAALTKLCCFLPFEPKLFSPGFAEFVGHPLVDAMKGEGGKSKAGNGKVLAILPGSRIGEIEKHLPILLRAADALHEELPNLRIAIPAANKKALAKTLEYTKIYPYVQVTLGGAREILAAADCAAIASGTATFEAALMGCPFVVVYRVSEILAMILRRILTGVKHVGLLNVIAEKANVEAPMPELLQENFTTDKVITTIKPWLIDDNANKAAREALSSALKLLSSDGDSIAKIARILV